MNFEIQTDNSQFILTSDAEKYIHYRDLPVCQVCKQLVSDIRMSRGTGKQGIWIHNVFHPFIIFDFHCHGSSLRFKTFAGEVAGVEERL